MNKHLVSRSIPHVGIIKAVNDYVKLFLHEVINIHESRHHHFMKSQMGQIYVKTLLSWQNHTAEISSETSNETHVRLLRHFSL